MASTAAIALVFAGWVAAAQPVATAQLTTREDRGELQFWSMRTAGRHPVEGQIRYGHPVVGEIVVTAGGGSQRRVHSMRIEAWGEDSFVAGGGASEVLAAVREGFGVWLEPGPGRNDFKLKLDFAQFDGSDLERTQVVLRHERGAYQLTVAEGTDFGQTRRGETLVDLMLDYPEPYRQFETVAHACSLPGISLVPYSLFSPSVIQQVIEGGTADADSGDGIPPAETSWPELVTALDSDQFSVRERARKALLLGGPALAVYLENLDRSRLSFEQRAEIEYLVSALAQEDRSEPEPLPRGTVAQLRRELDPRWLARLVASADALVRNWSLDQLRQQGIDIAMPPDPTRYDRREAFRRVWSRLSGG